MPEEMGGFEITSVGVPKKNKGYKDTPTYKKLGWCAKSAVKSRIKNKNTWREMGEKLLSEYSAVVNSLEKADDDLASAELESERLKIIRKARSRYQLTMMQAYRMKEEQEFGFRHLTEFRARARVNIAITRALGLDTESQILVDEVGEVEDVYSKSDYLERLKTKMENRRGEGSIDDFLTASTTPE